MIVWSLVLLLSSVGFSAIIDSKGLHSKETPNFVFTYPRVLVAGTSVPVCLTLYDSKLPAVLSIAFKNSLCSRAELCGNIFQLNEDNECFDINVPKLLKSKNQTGFSVILQTNKKKVTMNIISTVHKHDYMKVFIRTDKYQYRGGELVNIRIMAVPDNFHPAASYVIPEIILEDPVYNIAKIWKDVPVINGFAQLEYMVSKQARIGRYKVIRDQLELGAFSGVFYVNKEKYAEFKVIQMGRLHNNSLQVMLCGKYQDGINVPGEATLIVRTHMAIVQKVQQLRAGCTAFTVPIADLGNKTALYEVEGTIMEYDTNNVYKKKAYIKDTTLDERLVKLLNKHDVMKPGLPLVLKFTFARELNMFTKQIRICYGVNNHEYPNCIIIPLVVDVIVEVTIPPIQSILFADELVINGIVGIANEGIVFKKFKIAGSKKYKPIAIRQRLQTDKHCNNTAHFDILLGSTNTTESDLKLYYAYSSNGRLIKSGEVKGTSEVHDWKYYTNVIEEDNTGYIVDNDAVFHCVILQINLEEAFVEGSLLVHTLMNNDVVDDETTIMGQSCLPVTIKVTWSNPKIELDNKAVLEIRTNKKATCAITALEKSALVDMNNDDYMPLTQLNLFKTARDIHDYSNRRLCQQRFTHPHLKNRSIDESNIDPLLGVTKQFRKVYCKEMNQPDATIVQDRDSQLEREFVPRNAFASTTLIWDIIHVSADSTYNLSILPSTVGTWLASAICLSATDGIGISTSAELTVAKPFSLIVTTPGAIVLDIEILRLPVTIVNYYNMILPIQISVETKPQFKVLNAAKVLFCIMGHDSKTHYFNMKAVQSRPLNITVVAEITNMKDCPHEKVQKTREVAKNTIEVFAIGHRYDYTDSIIVCTEDLFERVGHRVRPTWTLAALPKEVIGRPRPTVTAYSNLLGPIIDKLDTLFPPGIGNCEQAISGLLPSLFILQYFKRVNRPMDDLYNKTVLNLETGYQDILGYLSRPGQFAAFRNGYEQGSLYLSSYAFKTLHKMKPHVFVDDDIVLDAVAWTLKHQMPNGCFKIKSDAFDHMGLDTPEQTPALTAFIMISLLESEIKVDDNIVQLAQTCIQSGNSSDTFTRVIGIYALALMGVNVRELFQEQLETFTPLRDTALWQNPSDSNSSVISNIKIASYLLITSLTFDQTTINKTLTSNLTVFAYQWMQSQLVSGYGSTRPTALALEGVYRFVETHFTDLPNVDATFGTRRNGMLSSKIRPKNQYDHIKRSILLMFLPDVMFMLLRGRGCIVVQAFEKLNVKQMSMGNYFELETEARPVFISTTEECFKIQLIVCIKVTGDNIVNLGVLEIATPTGYVMDDEMVLDPDAEHAEQIYDDLIVYTKRLSKIETCVTVVFKRKLMVQDVSNPTVKVYDYNSPDKFVTQIYKMPDCKLIIDNSNNNKAKVKT